MIPDPGKRLTYASIAILIVSFSVLFVFLSRETLRDDAIEKVTGAITQGVLAAAFISWLLWRSWLGRKQGYGLFAFSILCAIGSGYFTMALLNQRSQRAEINKNTASALASMLSESNRVSYATKSTGNNEMDQVLRFVADVAKRNEALLEQMETELEASHQPEVYADEILKSRDKLSWAIERTIQGRKIIEAYRLKVFANISQSRQEIASLSFSEPVRKGVSSGFENSMSNVVPLLDELFDVRSNRKVVDERFLRFMLENFDGYVIAGESIRFSDKDRSSEYKLLTLKITEAQKAQEALREKLIQFGQSQVNKLKAQAAN